jgi:hypothetical protein
VPRENAQQVHFLNFLLCFVSFYLHFYSSYIFRMRLRTTRQMTSSTISSIAPEEARPAVILGTTLEEEVRLAAILGTTKCQCLHVFTLDLYVYMDLWSCLWILYCVWMWWILWSLNECVGYCDVWMNVLDLDLNMDVLYIVCANCAGFLIPVVLVILFSAKKL